MKLTINNEEIEPMKFKNECSDGCKFKDGNYCLFFEMDNPNMIYCSKKEENEREI